MENNNLFGYLCSIAIKRIYYFLIILRSLTDNQLFISTLSYLCLKFYIHSTSSRLYLIDGFVLIIYFRFLSKTWYSPINFLPQIKYLIYNPYLLPTYHLLLKNSKYHIWIKSKHKLTIPLWIQIKTAFWELLRVQANLL